MDIKKEKRRLNLTNKKLWSTIMANVHLDPDSYSDKTYRMLKRLVFTIKQQTPKP